MHNLVYKSLTNDQNNLPERKSNYRFRTSMLSFCERKIIYSSFYKGDSGDFDGKTLLTFAIGTQIHEVIQSTLVRNGIITNCEDAVYWEKYSLNGHRDGDCYIDGNNQVLSLNLLPPNTNAIFELKTINAQGFMRNYWNRAPKKDHIHQVNTYMGLTGYKKAAIVYINKNGLTAYTSKDDANKWPKDVDQYMQTFIVDFDPVLFQQTENKLQRLNFYYDLNEGDKTLEELCVDFSNINDPTGIETVINKDGDYEVDAKADLFLPPKLPSGSSECNYCNFKSICKPSRIKKSDMQTIHQL